MASALTRPPALAALPDSIASRSAGARSSRSSLATLFSGIRSGWPVPNTKSLGADRLQQGLEVVLRRAPDPADVPPDAPDLLGRGAEVHLLDEGPVGVRDHQAHARVRPDQRAHRGGGQLGRMVVGVALATVLQPHGEHQREPRATAGTRQRAHGRARGSDAVVGRIAADRRRARPPRPLAAPPPRLPSRDAPRARAAAWDALASSPRATRSPRRDRARRSRAGDSPRPRRYRCGPSPRAGPPARSPARAGRDRTPGRR